MHSTTLIPSNTPRSIRSETHVGQAPTQDQPPPDEMAIRLESASEVVELLHTELPCTCRVSVRLSGLVGTQELTDLVRLLRQKLVQLEHLSLNLSPTVEAPTLIELLKEVEAHHARQALGGLELVVGGGHGGPIAEPLREAIAGSALCLTLGGARLRSMLFSPLSLAFEGGLGPTPTQKAEPMLWDLKTFIEDGVNPDNLDDQLGCLASIALCMKDAALMRALSALSPANTVQLFQLLKPHEDEWLDELQICYRLAICPFSKEKAQALAEWLARPHPTLWALELVRNYHMSAPCWTQVLQGLLAQPCLRVFVVDLKDGGAADALPANVDSSFRLLSLQICLDENYVGPDAVALLVHCFKPHSLALEAQPKTVEFILAQLRKKSPSLFDLGDMHLGWTEYSGARRPGQALKNLFKAANKAGFVCRQHAEPRTERDWDVLARRVVARCLLFSTAPGRSFGMRDHDGTASTLRFVRVRDAYKVGAGEAVVQYLLIRHDRFGIGQPDVARQLIKDTAFSDDDFKALACVHKDGHRAGQVARIISKMKEGRLTAKELRDALSLPSEEQAFDLDLVEALWERLNDMSADESMWRLFNAATAA
jgi:hypothetical protein